VTKVLPEQLGRYRPRDPFHILIEAEPFCYLGTGLQNVEQPHLLVAVCVIRTEIGPFPLKQITHYNSGGLCRRDIVRIE